MRASHLTSADQSAINQLARRNNRSQAFGHRGDAAGRFDMVDWALGRCRPVVASARHRPTARRVVADSPASVHDWHDVASRRLAVLSMVLVAIHRVIDDVIVPG